MHVCVCSVCVHVRVTIQSNFNEMVNSIDYLIQCLLEYTNAYHTDEKLIGYIKKLQPKALGQWAWDILCLVSQLAQIL